MNDPRKPLYEEAYNLYSEMATIPPNYIRFLGNYKHKDLYIFRYDDQFKLGYIEKSNQSVFKGTMGAFEVAFCLLVHDYVDPTIVEGYYRAKEQGII